MIDVIQARYLVMDFEEKNTEENDDNRRIYGETFKEAMQKQDCEIENAAKKGRTWTTFRFYDSVFDVWYEKARQEYEKRGFGFRWSGYNNGVWQKDMIIYW